MNINIKQSMIQDFKLKQQTQTTKIEFKEIQIYIFDLSTSCQCHFYQKNNNLHYFLHMHNILLKIHDTKNIVL